MLNELSSSAELDISFKGCIAAGLQAEPLYLECRSYFLLYIYRSMIKKIAKKKARENGSIYTIVFQHCFSISMFSTWHCLWVSSAWTPEKHIHVQCTCRYIYPRNVSTPVDHIHPNTCHIITHSHLSSGKHTSHCQVVCENFSLLSQFTQPTLYVSSLRAHYFLF